MTARRSPAPRLFVHVGLHKTGTTYLQEDVFPRLSGLSYAPMNRPLADLVTDDCDTVLFSCEAFGGHPWKRPEGVTSWIEDFERRVANVARLFPTARILIGFRRHHELLLSLYKQHLQEGGTLRLEDFLTAGPGRGLLDPDGSPFRRRIEFIERRFGSSPFVYVVDELTSDGFLADLCEFLGVPVPRQEGVRTRRRNVGVGKVQATVLRTLNVVDTWTRRLPFIPSLYSRPLRGLGLDPRTLCQTRLRWMGRGQFDLDRIADLRGGDAWDEDWHFVLENRAERLAG